MSKAYFLEYSEDEVIPVSASAELFRLYQRLQSELGQECEVFPDKNALMLASAEYAHYARHGARDFRDLSDEEMREIIKYSEKELRKKKEHEDTERSEYERLKRKFSE